MTKTDLTLLENLSASLEIELSEPAGQLAPQLLNEVASPTAKITSILFDVEVDEGDDFRKLTKEELDTPIIHRSDISIVGLASQPVAHQAPNGKYFTLQDLLNAITETERKTRGLTEWFGGIDVHHVFFEGIKESADGAFHTFWGS